MEKSPLSDWLVDEVLEYEDLNSASTSSSGAFEEILHSQGRHVSDIADPQSNTLADLKILSHDNIAFIVHKVVLLGRSQNRFAQLITDEVHSIQVKDNSEVLNWVLHVFYDKEVTNLKLSIKDLEILFQTLPRYGLPVSEVVARGTTIFTFLVSLARLQPIDAFALASHHNLEVAAVKISSFMNSISLSDITERHSLMMGPVYLRRLVFMHLGRKERLKVLLLQLPYRHPHNQECIRLNQQHLLELRWREAAFALSWELSAGLPLSLIQTQFAPIFGRLECLECRDSGKRRLDQLMLEWSLVKNTI